MTKDNFLSLISKLTTIGIVIASLLIVIMIGSWIFTGKLSFLGYRPFYILTDSMEPNINVGDIVIAKAVDAKDVRVNDIVCYDFYSMNIIHRVVDINEKGFVFKGDNNETEDDIVKPEQIQFKIIRIIER